MTDLIGKNSYSQGRWDPLTVLKPILLQALKPDFSQIIICRLRSLQSNWRCPAAPRSGSGIWLNMTNTKIVKLVHPHRCLGSYWGLGVLRGPISDPRWLEMVQNAPKWSVMAQYGLKWIQYDLKWPKMTLNDLKCYKMVQYGLKWYKMVQNGLKWSKMAQNDLKWSEMVRSGHKRSEMVSNCPKLNWNDPN